MSELESHRGGVVSSLGLGLFWESETESGLEVPPYPSTLQTCFLIPGCRKEV